MPSNDKLLSQPSVIVFGASGAIGSTLVASFDRNRYTVLAGTRNLVQADQSSSIRTFQFNAGCPEDGLVGLEPESINAVVWAQGANLSDSIYSLDIDAHLAMYEANVTFILLSLQALLSKKLLAPSARLCIISSIWQNIAKQNKLSYCITKSALQGLVQSLEIDLGASGILVNAVLPGALDTPMTRTNLDALQIKQLEKASPLGTLATLEDVTNLVEFLCSEKNTGITGQFITADRGFSYARII
jgi:3-oxoacyl-[acyl-carrier protein] reductase